VAEITDIGGIHKCGNQLCECQVSSLNTYCSDYCSDADDEQEIELQCDCKHAPCALDDDNLVSTMPDPDEVE
jgi:hypothetical protein